MHCETLSNKSAAEGSADLSEAARRRLLSIPGEPLFLADWLRPVFIHYEVPAAALQHDVPFELDLHDGKAYVSMVAFTMRRMRPFRGGYITEWMLKPIANNAFLNVRTYVRHSGEPGIYFLTEWMNNPISVHLGPVTFGLPYRFGKLNYQHRHEEKILSGNVRETAHGPALDYEATLKNPLFAPCPADSLHEFLLERYTAFTAHKSTRRFFRIWHEPWKQQPIQIRVTDLRLLEIVWPWFADAKLAAANYSPGARDVWMGRPHRVKYS
jgi:uncharacterized protein YqjF (DUF2071 family)